MVKHEGTFASLDFGTTVSSSKMEVVEVNIDTSLILDGFSEAYYKELNRRNPAKLQASGLTPEALSNYFIGLVKFRVLSISPSGFKDWRKAKACFIPSWIEFTLSRIGVVVDNVRGLKFIPVMEDVDYNMDEMLGVSDILQSFIQDGIVLHKDALPRDDEGDYETMSMAIVDGYVKSVDKFSHPVASYVAAFLGFTLKKEIDFKMLYRVTYDDIDFIRTMLLAEETIR